MVSTAEKLQATLGGGPCVEAASSASVVVADELGLAERWPVYCVELTQRTPFRSVAAVPLIGPGGAFAALNGYRSDPILPALPSADQVVGELGAPIAALLLGVIEDLGDLDQWITNQRRMPSGREDATNLNQRMEVWTAVGMLMEAADLGDHEALSILRSYAYRRSLTVDAVGSAVVHRRLSTHEILAP